MSCPGESMTDRWSVMFFRYFFSAFCAVLKFLGFCCNILSTQEREYHYHNFHFKHQSPCRKIMWGSALLGYHLLIARDLLNLIEVCRLCYLPKHAENISATIVVSKQWQVCMPNIIGLTRGMKINHLFCTIVDVFCWYRKQTNAKLV